MTFDFWHIHLCFALLVFLLLPVRGRSLLVRWVALLGPLALGFLPVGELPLAQALQAARLAHSKVRVDDGVERAQAFAS